MIPRLRSEHDGDIARLAIPALGTLVAEPLYVLADTAIVGRLGTPQLAGLALATTVLLSIHGLLIFLAYGTTATVSRLLGVGDTNEAARVSIQNLWLALALGLGSTVLVLAAARPLLVALGGSGPALDNGLLYLRISAFGLPALLVALAGAGIFHGRQNTRTPLAIAVSGAVGNLVLESVLVFGLGYGVGASALSTVVAQMAVAAAFVIRAVGWGRTIGVSMRPSGSQLVVLLAAGRPLMLRTLALRGAFTLATAVAARMGTVEVAAHQVGLQIWSTLALALDAVAIAGQALTGRWLGAGDVARARAAARRMVELDVAVGVGAAVAILALRQPIAHIFSRDPEVVAAVTTVLIWVAVFEPINGYVFALDGILIGAGDLRYLGRSMAVVATAFAAMAIAVSRWGPTLTWLWLALGAFMALRAGALWVRWRGGAWAVTGRVV
ncbi:MAG: MATE family efflux transporter [Actinomycetota bacterium]